VYLQSGAAEKSRQTYESAIQLNPQDDSPYLGMANACAQMGRTDDAKRYREKFEQLRAGSLDVSRGRRSGFDDVRTACYSLAQACTIASRLYRTRGNLAEAERLCRRAAQVAPRHIESRQTLVWLYRQSGRTSEAIRVLEQLAEIEPRKAEYPLEIGRLYGTLGETEKADQWLRRARALEPDAGERLPGLEASKEK
jgi:tetratricopeptide (TPR) repeat protein